MQKSSKTKYSAQEERQAGHMEDNDKKNAHSTGHSIKTAQQAAWANVTKQSSIAPKKPVHRKTHKIQNRDS